MSFSGSAIRELLYNALIEYISKGHLSSTMKLGLMNLIPKSNKDKLSLDNSRPMMLLRNDDKLLAHVYSNRLDQGLTGLSDECQSALKKGRNSHNNMRLILDMLDYRDYISSESYGLF